MGLFFVGALAAQAHHAALGHERCDAGNAQLGGFFDQPIHALIGGHADGQMHSLRGFALNVGVRANDDAHIAAPHVFDLSAELAA